MINIHVGTIPRSGGSLLCRLFDGHPAVASYPVEVPFPVNSTISPHIGHNTGYPYTIPQPEDIQGRDALDLLNIQPARKGPVHQWGKESSDILGVRKNYLEKAYYDTVRTDFDYELFIRLIQEKSVDAACFKDLWNARHRAYFEAWDNNRHAGNMQFVVTHASSGLYLSNFGAFFNEFADSFYLCSIRDVMGYIASEKSRLARLYFGSRRFPKVGLPASWLLKFDNYDLAAYIGAWSAAMTRLRILQEKFAATGRFVVYRYENLVADVPGVMQTLCDRMGLEYQNCLLEPTIAGEPWGGNSHRGKQRGINRQLARTYTAVLRPEEMRQIENSCGDLQRQIDTLADTPVDLKTIPEQVFQDYTFQSRYFEDEEKMALYGALSNAKIKYAKVRPPRLIACQAVMYAFLIRIIHFPRLLKLRLLPGWGRQNYT